MLIDFNEFDFFIWIAILIVLLPILWWRKRNFSYLLFFAVFWVYLLAVVQVVIFPFMINVDNGGAAFRLNINLIPFYFGGCSTFFDNICLRSITDNIILTIPFGFGICFLAALKPKNAFWLALAVGLGFELSQLIICLVFKSAFRAIDINDVILNATGVLLGYACFRLFAGLYLTGTDFLRIQPKWLFADIYKVALQTRAAES